MSSFSTAISKQRNKLTASSSRKVSPVHQYQKDGIDWIVNNLFCGLFLAPGLGKTLIVLMAFLKLRTLGQLDRLLVVAPLRVCYSVWPEEVKKWGLDFSVGILHGKNKDKVFNKEHDIYVINPEGLAWLASRLARSTSGKNKIPKMFSCKIQLVVDESSLFRNGRSQRFKTLKRMLKFFNRRVILTGTPAPNGLEGLWGQVYILDRGARLGEYITQYRNKYFYPSGYMGYDYKLQPGAEQEIYADLKDIILHRGRELLDLPPLLHNQLRVELPPNAAKAYSEMEAEFMAEIETYGIVAAVNGAVANGKLRQIANGAVYDDEHNAVHIHDEKTKALQDLVEELEGQPLMVFYEFNHDRDRILKAFPHAAELGSGKQTEKVRQQWNNNEIPILLLHPKSGGHGLNLQESRCRDICWYSIPWDLELYEQAYSRVWRQGVDSAITMHHIIATGTMDRVVIGALKRKKKVQKALVNALQ